MQGKNIRTEIFRRFREAHGGGSPERVERMLNAAMAGAALVAVADGHASFEEGAEAGNVASILEALQIFDPLTGMRLYQDYVHRARESEAGRAVLREIVQEVAHGEDERVMLIEICRAISRADGKVVAAEHEEILIIESHLQLRGDPPD